MPIVGDCLAVLKQVLGEVDKYNWSKNESARKDWMAKIKAWDKKQPFGYDRDADIIKLSMWLNLYIK